MGRISLRSMNPRFVHSLTHRLVTQVVDDASEKDLLADEHGDVAVGAARPVDPRVHDVLLREARLRRRRRARPPHAHALVRGGGRGGGGGATALVVILPAGT